MTLSDDALHPFAAGPVATVYSGMHDSRSVVYKVFPRGFDKRTAAAFARERSALPALPSILAVEAVERLADGRQALRMPLCAESLAALVRRVLGLPTPDVVALGRAIATALAAAHAAGVVHGGVTPLNVLFSPAGEPVLADFGTTLRHAFPRDPLYGIEYLAPETLRTGERDERTDLYGLGAVLHFALTGTSPHPAKLGEQPGDRVLRVLGEPVPAIDRRDVPVALTTAIARLLAPDPAHRPRNAATVADQLTALRLPPPTPPTRPVMDHPVQSVRPSATHPDPPPTHADLGDIHRPVTADPPPTHADRGHTHRPVTADPPPTHADRGHTHRPVTANPPPTHTRADMPRPNPGDNPPSSFQDTRSGSCQEGELRGLWITPGSAAIPGGHTAPAPDQLSAAPDSEPVEPAVQDGVGPFAGIPAHADPLAGRLERAGPDYADPFADIPDQSDPFAEIPTRPGARRKPQFLIAAGVVVLVAFVSSLILILSGDPDTVATTPRPLTSTTPPSPTVDIDVVLAPPKVTGNTVELTWSSPKPLYYAVFFTAEGEQEPDYKFVEKATSTTIEIQPDVKYCIFVQGSDSVRNYDSDTVGIHGATCAK